MAKYSLVKSSTVEQIAPLEVQVVSTSEVTTESIHAKRRHPDSADWPEAQTDNVRGWEVAGRGGVKETQSIPRYDS